MFQLPIIAIVGRPNVGKSTLFNCLTRSRDALVADYSGLTRDRKYGVGKVGGKPYMLVDTGGLFGNPDDLELLMQKQVNEAIEDADLILFVVDGREGLTQGDREISDKLRPLKDRVLLVVNKSESVDINILLGDFSELAMGEIYTISASHWKGVRQLADVICDAIPDRTSSLDEVNTKAIRVAIIGRPNVGKSTLINRLIGENRVLEYDMPGTTRDSISIPFQRADVDYELIDTAGIRRRSRVDHRIEKFSAIKAIQAIEMCSVAVILCDAKEGITDQDSHLIGLTISSGRALLIVLNKCDGLDAGQKSKIERNLDLKLNFINYAQRLRISALYGNGVRALWKNIEQAHAASNKKITTGELNAAFENIKAHNPPPTVGGRTIRMRYAHIGGHNPPTIIIHGNTLGHLPGSYKRYLENAFRETFSLFGTPLKLVFKTSVNPYADKKKRQEVHHKKRPNPLRKKR